MDELKKIVSKRLTELLIDNNISQAELARGSGVSKDTISKAINMRDTLSVKKAKQVADFLGVSLDYLYGNSDIKSVQHYALDAINRHIKSLTNHLSWGDKKYSIPSITISEYLANYLKVMREAGKSTIPDDLKADWIKRETDTFLEIIRDEPKPQPTTYALIPTELLVPEVLEPLQARQLEM